LKPVLARSLSLLKHIIAAADGDLSSNGWRPEAKHRDAGSTTKEFNTLYATAKCGFHGGGLAVVTVEMGSRTHRYQRGTRNDRLLEVNGDDQQSW
jgi:hypothetical protein